MRKLLKALGLLLLIVGICSIPFFLDEGLRRMASQKWEEFKWDWNAPSEDELSHAILMYLAQPHFSGDAFEAQVLDGARFALLDSENSRAYFIAPKDDGELQGLATRAGKFLHADAKMLVCQEEDGKHVLSYDDKGEPATWIRWNPSREYLFFAHPNSFRVDPEAKYSFEFGQLSWSISSQEVRSFLQDEWTYEGPSFVVLREQRQRGRTIPVGFARHMCKVGKKGAPLTRLVDALTANVAPSSRRAREERIQALVSFVNTQIDYIELRTVEVLKRPNEVLMSRKSDCSGKTILLASFLEQLGEDYMLCHYPSHIALAVPKGKFPTYNGLSFDYEGQTWVLCEASTDTDFQVGMTLLEETRRSQLPQYLELRDGRVLDVASGKALKLL